MYITTNYDLIRKVQEAKSITLLPPKVEIAAYTLGTGICYAEGNALANILVGQDGVDTTIIKVATCILTPIALKLAIAGTNKLYDSLGLHEHTPQGTAEKKLSQLGSQVSRI